MHARGRRVLRRGLLTAGTRRDSPRTAHGSTGAPPYLLNVAAGLALLLLGAGLLLRPGGARDGGGGGRR